MKLLKFSTLLILGFSILISCKKVIPKPTPTRVRITNITIINIPFVDPNGSSWDIGNGPDLFFKITDMDNTVLLDGSGSRIDDVVSSMLPVSWSLTTPFEITDFNSLMYVEAWDYDTFDPDDLIDFVFFL